MKYAKVPDFVMTEEIANKIVATGVPGDQIFQGEYYGLFNVGVMERLIKANPRCCLWEKMEITKALYQHVITKVEINEARVESLLLEDLCKPIPCVLMPDEQDKPMLIDGHHRVVKLWQMGVRSAMVALLHPKYLSKVWIHAWPGTPAAELRLQLIAMEGMM